MKCSVLKKKSEHVIHFNKPNSVLCQRITIIIAINNCIKLKSGANLA